MTNTSGLRLVRFATEKSELAGFKELASAGQSIRNVKDREYVISRKQCQLLSSREIQYKILKSL